MPRHGSENGTSPEIVAVEVRVVVVVVVVVVSGATGWSQQDQSQGLAETKCMQTG